MTQDEYEVGSLEDAEKFAIIRMARKLATRHGSRMCDEDGETHGEELYCVDVDDIAEIIKQVAAHEREACAKVCKDIANSQFESGETETAGVLDHCAAAIRARSEK